MTSKRSFVAALALIPLVLSACSANDDATAEDTSSDVSVEAVAEPTFDNLSSMDGVALVNYLETLSQDQRPQTIAASVRAHGVELADLEVGDSMSVEFPEDQFYVSFAPYVNRTHDCYFHSLTTCVGELQNQDVHVTIVSDGGDVLVDETVTTEDNGFVGYWLPSNIRATLTVEYDGKESSMEIGTGEQDPTCITSLQLS